MLFKIRRSEPKLIDYSPKCGVVEPGVTKNVQMKLVDDNVTFARLLVKMVALRRSHLTSSFQDNWNLGAQKGIVKKVVDIRNKAFMGAHIGDDNDDNFSESMASEDVFELASPGTTSPHTHDHDDHDDDDNHDFHGSGVTSPQTENEDFFAINPDDHKRSALEYDSTPSKGFQCVSKTSSSPFTASPKASYASHASSSPLGKFDENTKRNILNCSSVRALISNRFSKAAGTNDTNVIQISGEQINQGKEDLSLIEKAFTMRAVEVFESRQQVTGVEINDMETAHTFGDCIGSVFMHSKSDEVDKMRAMMLDTSLKHIFMNQTSLRTLDTSINRFVKLTSLDLSSNDLEVIEGVLNLPLLQRLDVSRNALTSLDYLQSLISLKTLNASNNRIKGIRKINVLVSLSSSLTNIDLSGNPLTTDKRYAFAVVSAFPKLVLFDSRDLHAFGGKGGSYSRFSTPTRGRVVPSPSPRGSAPPSLPYESTPGNYSRINNSNDNSMVVSNNEEDEEMKEDLEFNRRLKEALRTDSRSQRIMEDPVSNNVKDSNMVEGDGDVNVSESMNNMNHTSMRKAKSAVNQLFDKAEEYEVNVPVNASATIAGARVASAMKNTPMSDKSTVHQPFSTHLTSQTKSSRGRRKSQQWDMLLHWNGHNMPVPVQQGPSNRRSQSASPSRGPPSPNLSKVSHASGTSDDHRLSSLTRMNAVNRNRRKSFGIISKSLDADGNNTHEDMAQSILESGTNSGYTSDGGTYNKSKSYREQQLPDATRFEQMQEDPRYAIYHPRYRVPKKVFGYSKPFAHTYLKKEKNTREVPLYDKWVKRMRDGFEKLPTRGTFARASKGLPAEWYPMDVADVEAIRRQGYFHEVIGDIQKYSYKDFRSTRNLQSQANLESSIVEGQGIYEGSIALSPVNKNRRATIVQHQSRQYRTTNGTVDTEAADEYSDYRKWYPSAEQMENMGTDSHTLASLVDSFVVPNHNHQNNQYVQSDQNQYAGHNNNNNAEDAMAQNGEYQASYNTQGDTRVNRNEPADNNNNNNSVSGGDDNISGRGNNPSKSNTSGRLSADTEEEKLQVYLEWLETEGNQQQSSEPSQSYPFRDRNKQ